jgi:pimeloyl-ACP methyl ester carboxylesterase
MSLPHLVVVPGAWHSPDGYDKVIHILSHKGYQTHKVHLPSVGGSPAVSSIEPDVKAIRDAALAEMRVGHDVVVVCHSYGGVPTGEALKGLGKPQTAGGGRVAAIVYIAAYLVPEGTSLVAALTGHGGVVTDDLPLQDDGNIFFKPGFDPATLFYNDVSPEEAKDWVSKLRPQSFATFTDPPKYAAWKDIPTWYLLTKQDKAIAPEIEHALVNEAREYLDKVGGPGAGERSLKCEEIDSSHSPFLSHPKETAKFIEDAAVVCE